MSSVFWSRILAAVLSGAALSLAGLAAAEPPIVSNVVMSQRPDGSGLVDIGFDVADADQNDLCISLQFSDDGGSTWQLPVVAVSGDVGPGIAPGPGKSMVWAAGSLADRLSGDAFRVRVLASDVGVAHPAVSPRHTAIMDFSQVNWSDPANIEKYSRADLLQIMASNLWMGGANGDVDALARIRELNPDIRIVGYVSVKSAQLSGAQPWADQFWQEWYTRTQPYWSYTTLGDTLQDWVGNVVINILDPACRNEMISLIVKYQRESLNTLDGVFWDYFNTGLWIPASLPVEGEADLDGDGIPHSSDADELAAYRLAQEDLVRSLRDSLGGDYLQIFNGQRAYRDLTFASMANGLVFELFPTLHFPDPDMRYALDPDYVYSLPAVRNLVRTDNGGPYMVLTNPWLNYYIDHEGQPTLLQTGNQFRAVALVVDAFACWSTESGSSFNYIYGWPEQSFSLGEPLGPPVYEEDFIRRDFRYGQVEIEMTSGRYPDPFDYRVWENGVLVEELAIPFHYP